MNIAFISNYYNHHQKCFAEFLNSNSKNFRFIETDVMSEERKKLGYGEETIPCYVVKKKENGDTIDIDKYINLPDIVITSGSKIKVKSQNHFLRIICAERIYKNKTEPWKRLIRILKYSKDNIKYKHSYLLCASAYTAYDYHDTLRFSNRMYKWGYFPETRTYDIQDLLKHKRKTQILWCGRFLDWKHPDNAILVAEKLKDAKYDFNLLFIGNGVGESQLKIMVAQLGLEQYVTFMGSMSPRQVREYMESSGIYLFTSDRHEGWGAVLNESMNSGCAVVASHAIGAVPYLMKNKENGLIYRSGDIDSLYNHVKFLLDNPQEQERLGKNAYETITTEWNAGIAVNRLLELSRHIIRGEKHPDLYESGPCSKAEIIKDNWFVE